MLERRIGTGPSAGSRDDLPLVPEEPVVPRCPLDDTPLQRRTLPQPGRRHACPACGLWWP